MPQNKRGSLELGLKTAIDLLEARAREIESRYGRGRSSIFFGGDEYLLGSAYLKGKLVELKTPKGGQNA